MSQDAKKDTTMDPIVINSLVVLGSQLAGLIIKYSDPNFKAPTPEVVAEHLERFKQLPNLPTEFDEGFVDSIIGQIQKWLDSK